MKTVLITGGSRGIGCELSKLFARDKYRVILVARDQEKLEEVKNNLVEEFGIEVKVIVKDLAEPNAAREVFTNLQAENITVDVLVNNAGFGVFGGFAKTDLSKEIAMIMVNVGALVNFSKLFLYQHVTNNSGMILNIASLAGFQAVPFFAVYAATKAFVINFSEALSYELRGTNVSVTTVCPGPVATEFKNTAGGEKSRMYQKRIFSGDRVAAVVYRALFKRKRLVIIGFGNKILYMLGRIAPRFITTFIAGLKVAE